MDVNRIKETFEDISNKPLSGTIGPEAFNRYLFLVNIDLFKLKAGLPETYDPLRPYNQSLQSTFKVSDDIDFLMVPDTDIMKSADGFYKLPSDYGAMDYVLYGYIDNDCGDTKLTWKPIETVTGSERAIRLDSHLIPPTAENPILSWTNLGFRVEPDTINQIRLNYLRLPVTPVWGYTMSGDQPVYDQANSTDAEWPDTMFGDFVIRVCRYAGIEIREAELVQLSQQRQIRGE